MKAKVLFLCTGNSARSQMAEALLGLIAGDHFEAYSVGSHPVGIHSMTVQVMKELAVDFHHNRSKHIDEFQGQAFDYVITMCDRAKESCSLFTQATKVLHWSFEDPAAALPGSVLSCER